MCGRFSLAQDSQKILQDFELDESLDLQPHYNIFPGKDILIIRHNDLNHRISDFAHWGLIPPWQKEEDISTKWINARAETITEKRLFKNSFYHKRCLIVADGFYEWMQTKIKLPYYFHLKNHQPFGFAGIWEHWENDSGKVINSCCILTTEAEEPVKSVHNRMPIIIPKECYQKWLKPAQMDTSQLTEMTRHFKTNSHLIKVPVSTYVNSPSHEGKTCIEPLNSKNDP